MVTIQAKPFGVTGAGQSVTAYEMTNDNGVFVRILDLGGTVQTILVPDRRGVPTDIVLGYDDPASYEKGTCYYGGIVGRCANRIGGARFTLDGREYLLQSSPGETNHVHGVFHRKMFAAAVEGEELVLRYVSPAMEEGYPGSLTMTVGYRLTDDNALILTYRAVTDAPTLVNLTNHTYFNLNGQDGSTVLNHRVQLHCSYFTEYTPSFAQTGAVIPVDGTPLDFRTEHTVGSRFLDDYHQLRICTGYDHNMPVDGQPGELRSVGSAASDVTGISVEAFTTEPAIQFYSGNYMHFDPVERGKNGVRYPKNGGLCFEAQHYPDAVHHPNFPSVVLRPGREYRQTTVYRFHGGAR